MGKRDFIDINLDRILVDLVIDPALIDRDRSKRDQ